MKKIVLLGLTLMLTVTLAACNLGGTDEPLECPDGQSEVEGVCVPDEILDTVAPVLNGAADVTVDFGSTFDPLAGVTASDDNDSDLTIVVSGDTVNTSVAGDYDVIYTVTDEAGNKVEKTITVTVSPEPVDNDPVFAGVSDVSVDASDAYDLEMGITVSDTEDGDITDSISYSVVGPNGETTFDPAGLGVWIVTYSVTDAGNNTVTATRNVEIVQPVVYVDAGIMVNGTFDTDFTGWGEYIAGSASMTKTVTDGVAVLDVVSGGSTWEPRLTIQDIAFQNGMTYKIMFDAKSSVAGKGLHFQLGEILDASPYFTSFTDGVTDSFYLTEDWVTYEVVFTMGSDNQNGGLLFELGNMENSTGINAIVYLDNVKILMVEGPDEMEPTISGATDELLNLDVAFDPMAGVSASDNVDGDLTDSIQLSGDTVDTSTAGTYNVIYTVTDEAGNVATVTRVVVVSATTVYYPTWMGYNGITITADEDSELFTYVAFDGNWWDRNAQLAVTGFDGTHNMIKFTFTGTAGQTYKFKVEGNAQLDADVVATGELQEFVLDLSGMSEADRASLNKLVWFNTDAAAVGTMDLNGWVSYFEEAVTEPAEWVGYNNASVTENADSYTINYSGDYNWNGWDHNAQSTIVDFDETRSEVTFTVTGSAGSTFLFKIEGGGQAQQAELATDGTQQTVTIDLSMLTEAQRDGLNLFVLFQVVGSNGSLEIHGWEYTGEVSVEPAEWVGYNNASVTENADSYTINYSGDYNWNGWDHNAQSSIADFDGTRTEVTFTVTGSAGSTFLFKIEGGGQAQQAELATDGTQQTVTIDLSMLTEAQRDGLNLFVLFQVVGSNGSLEIHGWEYTGEVAQSGQAAQLDTPVGLVVNGTTLAWAANSNASSYEIYVDGVTGSPFTSSVAAYDLSTLGLAAGDYTITVKAIGDGTNYTDSAVSAAITHTVAGAGQSVQLDTPVGLVVNGTTLAWAANSNASSYEIYIDGVTGSPFTSSVAAYDLSTLGLTSGTYTITVKSIGDGSSYTDSEMSDSVSHTVN